MGEKEWKIQTLPDDTGVIYEEQESGEKTPVALVYGKENLYLFAASRALLDAAMLLSESIHIVEGNTIRVSDVEKLEKAFLNGHAAYMSAKRGE